MNQTIKLSCIECDEPIRHEIEHVVNDREHTLVRVYVYPHTCSPVQRRNAQIKDKER